MDIQLDYHCGCERRGLGYFASLSCCSSSRCNSRDNERVPVKRQQTEPTEVAEGEHFRNANYAVVISTPSISVIEIEPDHVAQLLDEEGIGRKLEAAGAVKLQTKEWNRRWTVLLAIPVSLAMARTLQCVAAFGLRVGVLVDFGPAHPSRLLPTWTMILPDPSSVWRIHDLHLHIGE